MDFYSLHGVHGFDYFKETDNYAFLRKKRRYFRSNAAIQNHVEIIALVNGNQNIRSKA